jgi:RNA polymerase sigma factor (sigma-70 family)
VPNLLSSETSYEAIVREHQAMVFRTLARLTGRRAGIEDLAQDVFLRLFRALPDFRNEALVSTYLYRIAVNVAQDEWKRRRREDRRRVSISDEEEDWKDRLTHPGQTPEERLQERQMQGLVEEGLLGLSDAERAVLVLYHQEEQSYQQIAAALGMPIGTVRTHLHRGRNKLREAIAGSAGRSSHERRSHG